MARLIVSSSPWAATQICFRTDAHLSGVCRVGESDCKELFLRQSTLVYEVFTRTINHDRGATSINLIRRQIVTVLHDRLVHETRAPCPGIFGLRVGNHGYEAKIRQVLFPKIGRASCRERGRRYIKITAVAA